MARGVKKRDKSGLKCPHCRKKLNLIIYNSTLNGKEKIFIYPVYDIQAGKL